jgi:hypothetical protein
MSLNFAYKYVFRTMGFFNMFWSITTWSRWLTSTPNEVLLRNLSPLKFHRARLVLITRTLGSNGNHTYVRSVWFCSFCLSVCPPLWSFLTFELNGRFLWISEEGLCKCDLHIMHINPVSSEFSDRFRVCCSLHGTMTLYIGIDNERMNSFTRN